MNQNQYRKHVLSYDHLHYYDYSLDLGQYALVICERYDQQRICFGYCADWHNAFREKRTTAVEVIDIADSVPVPTDEYQHVDALVQAITIRNRHKRRRPDVAKKPSVVTDQAQL